MVDEVPEAAAALPTAASAASIAAEVSSVDEMILKFLPFIGTLLGVIPGAQVGVPIVAGVGAVLQVVDNAAKAVAAGNPGAAAQIVLSEVTNTLIPGQPNSAILTGPASDPSAKGSA